VQDREVDVVGCRWLCLLLLLLWLLLAAVLNWVEG
jgi:hypothetical protein